MFVKEGNEWKGITWKRHYDDVRLASLGLLSLGLKAGEKAAILSNTRYEWKVADLAILGARGVAIPIYASNTADEAGYILNHAEVQIVFVEDDKQLAKVLSIRDKTPTVKSISSLMSRTTPKRQETKTFSR